MYAAPFVVSEGIPGNWAFFFVSAVVVVVLTGIFSKTPDKVVYLIWGALLAATLASVPAMAQIGRSAYNFVSAIIGGFGTFLQEFEITRSIGTALERASGPASLVVALVLAGVTIWFFWQNVKGEGLRPLIAFVVLFVGLWSFVSTNQVQDGMQPVFEFSVGVFDALPGDRV